MAYLCGCGRVGLVDGYDGTPVCGDCASRGDLVDQILSLRAALDKASGHANRLAAASRAYLAARDRSDPPGERAARQALEALL